MNTPVRFATTFRLSVLTAGLVFLASTIAAAQESGNIAGKVQDALTDTPLPGVQILIDDGRRGTATDGQGRFRVRELRSGWHLLEVRHIGYRPARRDSILVRGGVTGGIDGSR